MNENENFSDVVSDVDDEMNDLMKEGSYNNVHKFGQKPLNKQFKLMDVRFPSLMVKA